MTKPTTTNEPHSWWATLKQTIAERFSLAEDSACQEEIVEMIRRGVEFRGINLWVLIFATMIASLGLNVNSAAVIIGAMLISPLMGPIMGIGLSLGINDFELLKRSLRNFSLMMIVAITTSTLYFLISPLGTARSELLARTEPTTYDVLIAFFGGLAGIVAQSRKDRSSTVIPGVAIATALMPPLCTAGFGIATGQFSFFIKAFYLFFINTVFIALATFLIVRMLNYQKKHLLDVARERYIHRIMMLITLATFIPSVVIGLHMVRVSFFEAAVDKFVKQEFQFDQTQVFEYKKSYHSGKQPSVVELLLGGEPLSKEVIETIRSHMDNYGLKNVDLTIRQASTGDHIDLRSLQGSYTELLNEKSAQIADLKQQLAHHQQEQYDYDNISREACAIVTQIEQIALSKSIAYDKEGQGADTLLLCVVKSRGTLSDTEQKRLHEWLALRMHVATVKLFVDTHSEESERNE
jgi:uncharacterized hydrophobic protein (TIGR00271 family)